MDCYEKPQYISELAHLFLCSTENHIDTGAFMTRICEILADDKNQGKYPYFDLFLCTRKDNKTTVKSYKTADKCQVLHYLFDLCGRGDLAEGSFIMTLTDIVNRSKPYTQEEFMEGLIETYYDKTREVPWTVVVVTPERDFKFKNHDEAVGFLFDKMELFGWHVGSFAFSPSMNYLYIALFKNDG